MIKYAATEVDPIRLSPFRSISEKESPDNSPAFVEARTSRKSFRALARLRLFIASSRRLDLYGMYAIGYLTIVYPSQVFSIVFEGHPLAIVQSQ
jgi:hypothetical protein